MVDSVSASKAAKALGVSAPTILRWLEEGRFPNAVVYEGIEKNTVRIPMTDIEALQEKGKKAANG